MPGHRFENVDNEPWDLIYIFKHDREVPYRQMPSAHACHDRKVQINDVGVHQGISGTIERICLCTTFELTRRPGGI